VNRQPLTDQTHPPPSSDHAVAGLARRAAHHRFFCLWSVRVLLLRRLIPCADTELYHIVASLLPHPLRELHIPSTSSLQIDILPQVALSYSPNEPSSLIRRREKKLKKKSEDLAWQDRWRTEIDVEGERWELRMVRASLLSLRTLLLLLQPSRVKAEAYEYSHVDFPQKPNYHLLHPSATLSTLDSTSPLHRPDILAYEGTVHRLSPSSPHSSFTPEPTDGDDSTSLGWARLLVVDKARGLLSGAFSLPHTGVHHIQTTSTYLLHKHPLDPHPPADTPLIIFRDQDAYEPSSLKRSAAESSSGCGHDDLKFNTADGENLVHKLRLEQMRLREEIRFAKELEGDWKNILGKRQDGDVGGSLGGVSSE
jgi:hypothetical protein